MDFQVQEVENKGHGLVACKDITSGNTIFEEDPIVSCQFSWNKLYKYAACDFCMKSLETAEETCKRLAANAYISLPHPECCLSNSASSVTCPRCEVLYCSTECRDRAQERYHQVLCGATQQCNSSALDQLDETWRNLHYPPETATIWLLVRLIAQIKQADKNKAELIAQVEAFCHQCRNESEGIAHKLLGEKFKDQLLVLREQVSSLIYSEDVAHWFTLEGFQTLFALLGTNQQGVGTSSLSVWVENCDNLQLPEKERKELDEFIDNLYEELETVAGSFLNCEGAGLYCTQSKCNHSCSPNAEVGFLHNSHRLTLRAIKDITCGEEITISYLSECELSRSRHSRQKFLRENYVFTCRCDKCISEADQADHTSDEEEMEESDTE